jgi:hypothetical protein
MQDGLENPFNIWINLIILDFSKFAFQWPKSHLMQMKSEHHVDCCCCASQLFWSSNLFGSIIFLLSLTLIIASCYTMLTSIWIYTQTI